MKRFFINAAILVAALLVVGLLSGNWPAAVYVILIGITSMFAGYDAAKPWVLKKKITELEKEADALECSYDDLFAENKQMAKKISSMQVDNTSGGLASLGAYNSIRPYANQANHNKMLALNKAI